MGGGLDAGSVYPCTRVQSNHKSSHMTQISNNDESTTTTTTAASTTTATRGARQTDRHQKNQTGRKVTMDSKYIYWIPKLALRGNLIQCDSNSFKV